MEYNRAYLLRTEITKSHLNSRICHHGGVKTNTVTPSFYYVLNISLPCNINIRWWDLLLGNHLKLMQSSWHAHLLSPFQFTVSDTLKMGKSKPWLEALKKLTGSETLDVGALTEYLEPLPKWMVEQRDRIRRSWMGRRGRHCYYNTYRWSHFTCSSPVKHVCLRLGCINCVLSLKPSASCGSE